MTARLVIFYVLYGMILTVSFPLIITYFLWRARKDTRYRKNLTERFGFGPVINGALWIHAASIGEFRGSYQFIRLLTDRGLPIVITCLTPVGRAYVQKILEPEIKTGQVIVRYLPLEYFWCYRIFLNRCMPRAGVVLELETWPVMIAASYLRKTPLYLVNSSMTNESMKKVRWVKNIFGHPAKLLSGIAVKADIFTNNFRELGQNNIHIVGEFRFDQPITHAQIKAGEKIHTILGLDKRPVFGFSSVIATEEPIYFTAMEILKDRAKQANTARPLFVFVPRAPEKFEDFTSALKKSGFNTIRRSDVFDENLCIKKDIDWDNIDVIVGDSFGEMFFYISLCDHVIAGGGFYEKGAHNITEQILLHKTVSVGPMIKTIRFPAEQAIEAGLLVVVNNAQELANSMARFLNKDDAVNISQQQFEQFLDTYAGASQKAINMLEREGVL